MFLGAIAFLHDFTPMMLFDSVASTSGMPLVAPPLSATTSVYSPSVVPSSVVAMVSR